MQHSSNPYGTTWAAFCALFKTPRTDRRWEQLWRRSGFIFKLILAFIEEATFVLVKWSINTAAISIANANLIYLQTPQIKHVICGRSAQQQQKHAQPPGQMMSSAGILRKETRQKLLHQIKNCIQNYEKQQTDNIRTTAGTNFVLPKPTLELSKRALCYQRWNELPETGAMV